MKFWVIGMSLGLGLMSAQAAQTRAGNANNEKMCVCEPCGGKMVPCNQLKEKQPTEAPEATQKAPSSEKANSANSNAPTNP